MKRILCVIITTIISINAFTQDCGGISCVANPNIIQDDIIICYEALLDSVAECYSSACYQVCENSNETYSTSYNVGSTYSWIVTGGQINTTNTSGNIISILWGSHGVGSVYVEETDSIGCSSNTSQCVEIIPQPIPSILTIPSTTTICQNTNVQFISENLNSTTLSSNSQYDCYLQNTQSFNNTAYVYNLTYFWDFGDGITSTEQNPSHTYSSPGIYIVILVITNACQCSDTITTTIDVINTLGPEITAASYCIGALCEGDSIEYCTNAISPSWSVEGGVIYNSVNTDNCINVIWDNFDNELNDGSGSLFLADLSSACGSSSSIMSIPVVASSPFITGENNPCNNTYQQYSFACIPGVDYNWQLIGAPFGVSIIEGQGSSSITITNQWSAGSSYQILLDMSSSTLECLFNPISLNIDVLPSIYILGNSSVCDSSLETYSSPNIVEWEVINGTIQSPAGPPYIASQIDVLWDQGYGSGSVKVIPTSAGVFCDEFSSLSVNISENPQDPINIINDVLGDTLVCPGETYLYTVDLANATSNINATYEWEINGGTPATHIGDNCVITWNSAGPYTVEIVNTGSTNCLSNSFIKIMNSLSLTSPNINGNATVCTNDRSIFEITNIYPNDVDIIWTIADPNLGSIVSGQGSSNAIIEWGNQLGSTNVIVSAEICGNTVTSTFPVNLIGTSIDFTFVGGVICPQSNIAFAASSAIGDFSWDFGDGNTTLISNNGIVDHIYSSAGNYNIVLTLVDGNQCTSTANNMIEISGPTGRINPKSNSGVLQYCDGDIFTELLSVNTASNANPFSWDWYHNGTLVQSMGSNYTVNLNPPNYLESGSYSVVLTDTNGCSNSTDDLNLDVVFCGGGGGAFCGSCPNILIPNSLTCNANNGTWDITVNSPNGNPVNFFAIGLGVSLNTTTATFNISEAGTYHIICKDISGNQIGHEYIDVPFVVDWKSFAYCDSSNNNQITINFRDTSSYLLGISGLSYFWDFGDGNTSFNQNPTHTYITAGVYSVNFTVSYGGLSCNKTQQVEAEFNALFSCSGSECEQTPTLSFTSSNVQIDSWLWDFDDGATSAREMPDRTYSQSGLYNPSLLAISESGCVDSASIPLQIFGNPVILSLSPVNALCVNDPQFDLSTLVSFSNLNGEISVWEGVGIVYDSVSYYFNPLLAGGGTHEICVIITDNNGCMASKCINIIVICPEKPRVFGESDYCYNITPWLNYQNLETQLGFSDYTWYKDGILYSSPSSNNAAGFSQAVGSYDITVSFLDNNGCIATSEPFILQVNPSPDQVSVSSSGVCPATQITLTHTGNQSNVEYYWNTIPQQTGNSVDVIAEANFEYQVVSVNQFGCKSMSWNAIEIANDVNTCNIISGCFCDSSLIDGASGMINISGLQNTFNYSSYEWQQNGISFVPSQNSSSLVIDPLDPNYLSLISGNISLSVTDYYGCSYESEDLIIEPNCFSQLVSYVNQAICLGDTLYVGSNAYGSPGYYVDSLLSLQGFDSIIHTTLTVYPILSSNEYFNICQGDSVIVGLNVYNSPGSYIDTLSGMNNCDSIVNTYVNISDPDPQIILTGSSLELSIVGGTPPYIAEIGNQNGVIINQSLAATSFPYYYNPTINGLYYFIVIDDLGCISDTIFYLVNILPTSVDDYGIWDLNIFPNPSRDKFYISFKSENKQKIKVRIINLFGEVIFRESLEGFKDQFTYSFNLDKYPKGVYILELDTDNGIINKKLILH
jgi:PKD repeat protein